PGDSEHRIVAVADRPFETREPGPMPPAGGGVAALAVSARIADLRRLFAHPERLKNLRQLFVGLAGILALAVEPGLERFVLRRPDVAQTLIGQPSHIYPARPGIRGVGDCCRKRVLQDQRWPGIGMLAVANPFCRIVMIADMQLAADLRAGQVDVLVKCSAGEVEVALDPRPLTPDGSLECRAIAYDHDLTDIH